MSDHYQLFIEAGTNVIAFEFSFNVQAFCKYQAQYHVNGFPNNSGILLDKVKDDHRKLQGLWMNLSVHSK